VTAEDDVLIGKIVGVHGVKGNLKMVSFAETLEIFEKGSSIVLRGRDGSHKEATISWIQPHGRTALLSLAGVTTRRQGEELIGWELYIEKNRLPQLAEGVYYWSQLIGLDVITEQGSYLGKIESIIQTGSNDVYVVKHHEQETLVPALEKVVIAIDLTHNEMRVDLPEGL
jgi:16S rRNA processing protein RimM